MDDFWTLLLLSAAMLVGCYLAGIIPLAISLSEEKLKLVTVLGAGLLVGTALAVIIPEGIHALAMKTSQDHEHAHHDTEKEPTVKGTADVPKDILLDDHSLIGITLVSGFIFMLLVDQIGGGSHHTGASADLESACATAGNQNRHKITATLGLVVHAAADGVALGAAVTMSSTDLTLIVFIAIMLHKAPAAFGLVSFLLHEGFDRPRVKKHLFIFSLSAPLGAIVTFLCLTQKSMQTLNDTRTTGIAMLLSAGTFLYVATVHVLPEIANRQTKQILQDGSLVIREHKGFTKLELTALVTGAVVPVILSLRHHH